MQLSIVIPALDEERAIRATIERTLAARAELLARTPLTGVEVLVVSDGSTDRTPDIAREYAPDVTLISYRVNRGYGAALKLGFRHARGELLSFLDADGTCDPRFLVELVNRLLESGADIAIGNRMTAASSMPRVRRVGNRLFAALLGTLAGTRVSDAASGMRVLRRASLPRLLPLPDGLHFTPAMSSRALFDGLALVEVDMPYAERTGESKLSVLRDGLRFARVILDAALTYRPFRVFAPLGLLAMAVMGVFGTDLVVDYLRTRAVGEGMVFRVLAIIVLGTAGMVAFTLGTLGERAAELSGRSRRAPGVLYRCVRRLTDGAALFCGGALFILAGCAFVLRPAAEYLRQGSIDTHWSQVGLAGFLFLFGVQVLALSALARIFGSLLARERDGRLPHEDEEQVFRGPSGATAPEAGLRRGAESR